LIHDSPDEELFHDLALQFWQTLCIVVKAMSDAIPGTAQSDSLVFRQSRGNPILAKLPEHFVWINAGNVIKAKIVHHNAHRGDIADNLYVEVISA
jgi:translation initiation factor IF-1